jgi:hypothetical protein
MLQRCRISRSNASGLVRRLVMIRWQTTPRVPLLVLVVVMSSTIQAVPGQLALMCSGASLALSSQWV